MADNSSFMASINAFIEKGKRNQELVVQKGAIKILNRLVTMSPVGNPELWAINQTAKSYNDAVFDANEAKRLDPSNLTKTGKLKKSAKVKAPEWDIYSPPNYTGGRFRGNWQVGLDVQPDGETGRDNNNDPNGNMTMAVGNYMLEQFKVGTKAIYFTNNVPYALELELGHSSQAPSGLVRITAEDAVKYFTEAANEVNK
ncbi:hypothetical protein GBL98_08535 [Yersinia pseudotuberculosis]|uniref:hypothetical protein n=1 Tax=Yersinia pseudotuberculosis TaxID=633 RepID=UPI0005DC2876|nr:hypothetical protein [Yersinia pseudotuberculosis]AYX14024.1 hypothetical protein EGX44_01850 [Yersinia pseudotuberculosis]MBO1606140.1 hypothetical protein [Yersinia pseudotuberculosis]MBO1610292.1 hypothetical protein [Yersinia pseudotuberculosis]MBO1621183.1 hypothetical protein [Yersinia pseudotuberculosis]PSH18163.1 hypothetical protein BLA52_12035 [Yersinia pseudotuberculosis]